MQARNGNGPKFAIDDVTYGVEKFNPQELITLRDELMQSGVDSFQAADIVSNFLTGRGYGCSTHEARALVGNIETQGMTAEYIQVELERVARVM
ncbi:MAG: hypothetical protein ABI142_11860 [Bryocella sp.]